MEFVTWQLVLSFSVLASVVAVILYILCKYGYEIKVSKGKVEVIRKETPTQKH